MGLLRILGIVIAALLGVVIGAGGFLAIGLLAISPPDIGPAAPEQPWDITLDITDAFLTTQLNTPRASPSGGASSGVASAIQLTDAKAAMHADGTITITGLLGRSGSGTAAPSAGRLPINVNGNVSVEIVLRPAAADGKLTVEVVSAQFGPLSVPSNVGSVLEGPINEQIANALNGQSFALTELTVRDGAMLIRAKQSTP
jgi:hypothetical protein